MITRERQRLILNTPRELFVRRLRTMLRDHEAGLDAAEIAHSHGVSARFVGMLVLAYAGR